MTASPLYYMFPSEQRLKNLLRLNFPDKNELKNLSAKTIEGVAEFFAEKVLEQEQIPSNLKLMAIKLGSEIFPETVLGKIKEVFKILQQYGSIPYSNVDPNSIDLGNADLIAIAKRCAFLRSI